MKPIIREFLSSLRERNELDAIIPELLAERGFVILSTPSVGGRQYGVDVSAVGPEGDDRLYLFSIKRGDLTRDDWNGNSPQALRPSLDEIIDVYVRSHVPPEHKHRCILICICLGGEVKDPVRLSLSSYIQTRQTDSVAFEEWNGDKISNFIVEGLLREGLLTKEQQGHFRKAVAMVDEPEVSYTHFYKLVRAIVGTTADTGEQDRLRSARQIYICLWTLFVWARDASNLESAYRCSEQAVLGVWHLLRRDISARANSQTTGFTVNQLVELHWHISASFIDKVAASADKMHATSSGVWSRSALDVNLRLFETIGRVALRGLWHIWEENPPHTKTATRSINTKSAQIKKTVAVITSLIESNPALSLPVSESQTVDVMLVLTILAAVGAYDVIKTWVREMANRHRYAFHQMKAYTCIYSDYHDLCAHPKSSLEQYRKDATAGSVFIPTLAFWAAASGDQETLESLASYVSGDLNHTTLQMWLPSGGSEENLYLNSDAHGAALTDIPVTGSGETIIDYIQLESGPETAFFKLSATDFGHWPIVAMACRHYRLPLPPHIWTGLTKPVEA